MNGKPYSTSQGPLVPVVCNVDRNIRRANLISKRKIFTKNCYGSVGDHTKYSMSTRQITTTPLTLRDNSESSARTLFQLPRSIAKNSSVETACFEVNINLRIYQSEVQTRTLLTIGCSNIV